MNFGQAHMCAAGAFEPQEDAEDTQNAVQHDSDKLELEELDYRWIAAYQDHAMIAVVICTSNEQAEADLSAGLSEMPDGGNGAIVIDCGSDKKRAYTMVEEINGRYFPPSAAQTTPIDVCARGQATPEVTNSAISTRAQRVPSTPMPSGANATPTRTDGYSPASTAALRSMQQSPVAEQQAWDAEKMTAAANANLDEMQTMYKRLGAPFPRCSVGPTPMPTSRELSAAPLARSALLPQLRLKMINSARKGVQRPGAGGGKHGSSDSSQNAPAAPVAARTEPEPEPRQKLLSAEPQPELQQAAATDSMARLALWMVMFSITYGISGRTHISSIACVGAATLTNYSARRCPVTLVGVAEMVRNGIMRLVMNYTTVGFAILCALVVHYVLYAEPVNVNARAAAVPMPMMENPAAMAYLPGGWYTRPSSTGAGLMSEELTVHGGSDRSIQSKENACRPEEMCETTPALQSPPPSSPPPSTGAGLVSNELTVHGGSDRSIQSKENVCRPQEMRETTPALRSPPPSSPWPPPSPTPPLLYGLEDNEGLVAGVLQGKRLPFNSVNAKFFHDAFNHSEQRVLEHLYDALADAEPWWCQTIKNNPIGTCDARLKGNTAHLTSKHAGGGMAPLAAKQRIRITTNVKKNSRCKGVEPTHKVDGDVVRATLEEALMPLCFHDLCWAWWEDGHALKPSRQAPHDCSLARLTGKKPKGAYRRRSGILCYATEAPRLPSGTLVNKYKVQAVRCLCVGYSGGESGAYEALGNDRCQPGYICFDSEGCRLIVTEPVRFIVGCFPGLQRTAGGGWRIPERIPFSAEELAQKHPLALPQERPKPPNDGVVDIEQGNITTELGDFDHGRLYSYSKGLPLETEQTPQTDSRTTTRSTEDKAIVPREVWPDYPCNEQGGRRWLLEVIGKEGKHSKCKFKSAIDSDGRSFQSEWIETARLIPVDEQVEATTVTLPPSSPSPPSTPTLVPPTRPLPDAATTDYATASQRQRLDSVLTTDEVQQPSQRPVGGSCPTRTPCRTNQVPTRSRNQLGPNAIASQWIATLRHPSPRSTAVSTAVPQGSASQRTTEHRGRIHFMWSMKAWTTALLAWLKHLL